MINAETDVIDYLILEQLNMQSPLGKKELMRRLRKDNSALQLSKEELFNHLIKIKQYGYVQIVRAIIEK